MLLNTHVCPPYNAHSGITRSNMAPEIFARSVIIAHSSSFTDAQTKNLRFGHSVKKLSGVD